jgi:flagellar motility protein MotE (MotC chaperone)
MIKRFSIVLIAIILFNINIFAQTDKLIDLQKWEQRLNEKEKMLQQKEQSLNSKERELNILLQEIKNENNRLEKQKVELETAKSQLEELKKAIANEENQNLDRLAKIYSSTKAKEAAKIIAEMDVDSAVKLFQRMKPMVAGEILGALGKVNSKFASAVSEKLASAKDNVTKAQ